MFQISHAERSQTELITNDLRNFVKAESGKSNGGIVSAKDALSKFIAAEDAPYNGSLLGFSAGRFRRPSRCATFGRTSQLLRYQLGQNVYAPHRSGHLRGGNGAD